MKKKAVKSTKANQFLSWSSILKDLDNLKNEDEKIDYLQKVLTHSEFVRKSVIKKVEEMLGNFYIMRGYERKAGKLFKESGNEKMAKECYQTSNFFSKKDEKLLEEKNKELRKLEQEK